MLTKTIQVCNIQTKNSTAIATKYSVSLNNAVSFLSGGHEYLIQEKNAKCSIIAVCKKSSLSFLLLGDVNLGPSSIYENELHYKPLISIPCLLSIS